MSTPSGCARCAAANGPAEHHGDLRAVDGSRLAAALADIPPVRERLGGAPSTWRIREVGDGNLNLVFIVEGNRDSVVVKQALPYVRLVGVSWPLPLERIHGSNIARSWSRPATRLG